MKIGTWALVKGAAGYIARGKYVAVDALHSQWRTRVQSLALLWGSIENVAHIVRFGFLSEIIDARSLCRGDATVATHGLLLGSERHRYAIARPDEFGTEPMAYGGLN